MTIPAMTTEQELAYLESYASEIYSGDGEIVDLGCWLGATTVSLAKGLSRNPKSISSSRRIHAFDTFKWEAWMDGFVADPEISLQQEESFLPVFEKRVEPWSQFIEVHAGDLCEIGWRSADIEFLFIDAMKSWQSANSIVKEFFTSLIVNKSFVVHQDFAHYYTPWIHLINYRFRDYFIGVYDIPRSSSVVVKYVKAFPAELLVTEYSMFSFSDTEIDAAFDYSMQMVAPDKRANIAAANVMLYLHEGDRARALHALNAHLARGLSLDSELSTVRSLIGAS